MTLKFGWVRYTRGALSPEEGNANAGPTDSSFGVTSLVYPEQFTVGGVPVGTPLNLTGAMGGNVANRFSSTSELALNFSPDTSVITRMGGLMRRLRRNGRA